MFKKIVNLFLSHFGYKFSKINQREDIIKLTRHIVKKKNPTIFDIGTHEGETLDKFREIFPNAYFHCFEPIEISFNKLYKNYACKNIRLNNLALGRKKQKKLFYQYKKIDTSSFYLVNKKNKWLDIASKIANIEKSKFLERKYKVPIIKLDDYVRENKIKFIDILKIDTQGYELEILKGSLNAIKNKKINCIILEIILSDTYNKNFSFYEIEKILVRKNYRLYANDNYGNLRQDPNYQMNLLYYLDR